MSCPSSMAMKMKYNLNVVAIICICIVVIMFSFYGGPIVSDSLDYKLITTNKSVSAPNDEMMAMINNNILDSANSVLLTAVANSGMSNYTLNWIESLRRCNIDRFLVFAIDSQLVDTLSAAGYERNVVAIPEDWFHVPVSDGLMSWGNLNKYLPVTHSKSLVVEHLLYMNVTVWFSDVDVVFLSPHIYSYLLHKLRIRPATEALFQQRGIKDNNDINSGFFIMKPTDLTKHIISTSISVQDEDYRKFKNSKTTQQRAINRVIESLNIDFYTSPLVMLEMELFPVGNVYFDKNIPMKYGFNPLMVHGNFRDGDEKEVALRKAGLWYI
jgi:Nucleotide-diphospho-sugar transferase